MRIDECKMGSVAFKMDVDTIQMHVVGFQMGFVAQ